MKQNVGTFDKVVRILLALVFAYFGLLYSVWWYVLSLILIITVFTGYCWIYRLFGWSTVKKKAARKAKKAKKKRSKKRRK